MADIPQDAFKITLKALLKKIILGEYKQNLLPSENNLSAEYGVSRSTIRSVLSVLDAKGIILKQSKKKAQIMPIENWDWFDTDILNVIRENISRTEVFHYILFIRLTFEPSICALAALRCSIAELNELNECYKIMKRGFDNNDTAEFKKGDVGMHALLFKVAHNPFCNVVGNLILKTSVMSIDFTLPGSRDDFATSLNKHKQLIDAIRVQDAKKAKFVMQDILMDSVNILFKEDLPDYIEQIHH